ncbi:MAG: hypothetical protein KIT84_12225 [Labilithrix sp.]|nr:hypothetical protein [Labilithrix sp.]MCW5811779.1 hypothetical protein [Labilithrix sp.]
MRLRALALLGALLLTGCPHTADEKTKEPKCPPPPEPEHQAVVVGTIGRYHLVESRYPLAKLAETMAVFKPDLVLVAVRVDAFRQDELEDASFEMTYVQHLAKARGVALEPIDWWREADLGAPPPPVEPADEIEIERRETEVLRATRMFTFEQANGAELGERVLLAQNAALRHRAGDPVTMRRRAWIQELAADAALRHGRPKRVLAYVDVFDRPAIDAVLGGVGYAPRPPAEVLAKSTEALAVPDLPPDLVTKWRAQSERAKARGEKATTPAEKELWTDRAKVLDVAVEKRGGCCVTQSTFAPARP